MGGGYSNDVETSSGSGTSLVRRVPPVGLPEYVVSTVTFSREVLRE
jgi:hypothetical protein